MLPKEVLEGSIIIFAQQLQEVIGLANALDLFTDFPEGLGCGILVLPRLHHAIQFLIIVVVAVSHGTALVHHLLIFILLTILWLDFHFLLCLELLGLDVVADVADELAQLGHHFIFGVLLQLDENALLAFGITVEQEAHTNHECFHQQFVSSVVCLKDLHYHLPQLEPLEIPLHFLQNLLL